MNSSFICEKVDEVGGRRFEAREKAIQTRVSVKIDVG